jgi:acyl carrier protein
MPLLLRSLGQELNRPSLRLPIRESDALDTDLGCDSLDKVEITMEIEEQFDLSIPDEYGEKVRTVGDITDGVLQLLGQPNPGR